MKLLDRLINALFGCSHQRTTLPVSRASRKPHSRRQIYVVCLDCGKAFDYDWNTMTRGAQIDDLVLPARPKKQRPKPRLTIHEWPRKAAGE